MVSQHPSHLIAANCSVFRLICLHRDWSFLRWRMCWSTAAADIWDGWIFTGDLLNCCFWFTIMMMTMTTIWLPTHLQYWINSSHLFSDIFLVFTCVIYAEARIIAIAGTSVRLSVTRWYCIKTAEHIVMLSSPHDNPFILVLCISRSSRNSDGVTPCGAAKQRWGMKMSQFSTNNLLYLRNGWR